MELGYWIHRNLIQTAFSVWYGWQPYGRAAAYLEKSQWWTFEHIAELQLSRLKNLFAHAYNNVPFYKSRFEQAGLHPSDIRAPSDLAKLPVLTKRDIQDNLVDLLSRDVNVHRLRENHTGGSTGEPLTFYQDANYWAWGQAELLRNYRMLGYKLGTRWAFLWGSDYDSQAHKSRLGRLKDRVIFNTLWINTFDLTTDTLAQAAQCLANWNPEILVAYVSSATLLARLIKMRDLDTIRPRAIQTSAEVLSSDDRQQLEDVFGCKAFDRYGCREVGNIAHECGAHEGLHILAENNLVELVDDDGQPVPAGEVGRVVVTNLNNYAMPFIRYEIGDTAVGTKRICSCGRGLPLLEAVMGRRTDIIVSPSGKLLHGEFFTHLFYKIGGIYQFRVIQETSTDLRVQVVPGLGFEKDKVRTFLGDTIHQYGDSDFKIYFEVHDSLPVSASGKYRFTISNVPLLVR